MIAGVLTRGSVKKGRSSGIPESITPPILKQVFGSFSPAALHPKYPNGAAIPPKDSRSFFSCSMVFV